MTPDSIDGYRLFLEYGALGLAALMLVLVIAALTLGNLTAARERILTLFMKIGAACFVIAMAAEFFAVDGEHDLNLTVSPNDIQSESFPPPIILLNGIPVETNRRFALASDATILVDISEALGLFQQVEERVDVQAAALKQTEALSEKLSSSIASLRQSRVPAASAAGATQEFQQIETLQRQIDETLKAIGR